MQDIFEIENGMLVGYHGEGGDVIIPDGVTAIGMSVFEGREDIRSMVIPEGVTEIGRYAFRDCRLMENTVNLSSFHPKPLNYDVTK